MAVYIRSSQGTESVMPLVPVVIFDCVVDIMKAASLPLSAMKVSNTGDVPTKPWMACRDTLFLTPSNIRGVAGWEDDGGNCRGKDTWWHPRPQSVV